MILQCYSRRTSEPENQELIKTLGWKADDFIPPVRDHDDRPNDSDLGMLDDLWKSTVSEVERQLFYTRIIEQPERGIAFRDVAVLEPVERAGLTIADAIDGAWHGWETRQPRIAQDLLVVTAQEIADRSGYENRR